MNTVTRVTIGMLLVLGMWASDASADSWISPLVGVNFGGDAGGTFTQVANERQHVTYGFDGGGMLGGVFGLEFDFAYTRHFYGTGPGVGDNSVLTAMPMLLIGIPIGGQKGAGFRPYGTVGAGLIHRSLTVGSLSVFDGENSFGYSVGGGAMIFFADHIGIRGDYRYIRNFSVDDLLALDIRRGTFDFSRAVGAVVFRF